MPPYATPYASRRYQQPGTDVYAAYLDRLARTPLGGVNVHPEMQAEWRGGPSWIGEQAIEAIPLGDVADPVSQVAGFMAPGMLRGMRGLGEAITTPGPRLGSLTSERGNLGPPPLGPRGEPLPESALRTPEGQLQRYYHGTGGAYPDFDLLYAGRGAGGDLYGPGVYMTASPKIASEYARGDASKVFPTHVQAQYAAREMGTEVIPVTVRGQVTGYRVPLTREGANLRPVYANLKKPFDIEAPADPSMVKNFEEWGFNYHVKPDGSPDITTNKDVYETLLRTFGYKDEVNDWLLENGFDGIIHLGGSGAKAHKVSIAFSPESVYPSFGIDALLQKPIE